MHNLFFSLSLPLLLKLSAVCVTGTLTLVTCRNMHRNETLHTQMVDIQNSLRNLPTPPTIYVVGFKGRGKSAFINTACRVLAEEDGQFVFRTETAPLGPTRTTQHSSTIRAVDPDGRFVATLVDTPGLPIRCLTRSDVEAAVRHTHLSQTPSPDCIVVVLRCTDAMRLSELRLAEIVSVVRERGCLNFCALLDLPKL